MLHAENSANVDRSSAAWTIEQVVWVTKSNSAAFGRLRLSSVKVESMPSPTLVPGNNDRAAAASSSTVGFSGRLEPGCQDFRSEALETTIESRGSRPLRRVQEMLSRQHRQGRRCQLALNWGLIDSWCKSAPYSGIILARSNSTPARPYTARLRVFSLLICPSVCPLLQGSDIAFRTASKSWRIVFAKRCIA
jgi:hypothetical protein